MAKNERRGRFSGKASKSLDKQVSHSTFGYLNKDNINMYEPTPGKTEFLDFLPYIVKSKNHPDEELGAVKGSQWFKFPFQTHKNVGSGNGDTVVCLQTWGERCPICEYRAKRAKEGASKDELAELNVSKRALFVLRPTTDPESPKKKKKVEEDIQIMDISNFCFSAALNDELKEKPKYEDFADLEYGYTVRVRWNEEEFNKNKFAKAGRIDFFERDVIDESVLEEIPDLGKLLRHMDYEELKAKFFEIDDVEDDDDDDDDEDETPRRKKSVSNKSSKKSSKDDDDDDEDSEDETPKKRKPQPKKSSKDDDDDDDDEEETPKRKKPSSKKKEEDDDDEDETPKRKKPVKPQPKKSSKEEDDDDDDDDDDEDDDDEDEPSTEQLINKAKSVEDLMEIVDQYPVTFKAHKKKLKAISNVKKLKEAMLGVLPDSNDDDDDDLPFKKGAAKTSPKNKAEDLDDDDDETPKRKKDKKPLPAKKGKPGKEECPEGYDFGVDTEDYDECDECTIWEACIAKKEQNSRKK